MAWDLKRSKAEEEEREQKGGYREEEGGGYIRRVMAGMKPIANDAGIRDWQAKRCAVSSPASRCLPGRLDVAAISNVHRPEHRNKFNRNTLRVGIRQLGRAESTCAHEKLDGSLIFGRGHGPILR